MRLFFLVLPAFGNPNYSIYLGCKTGIIKKKLTIYKEGMK